MKNRIPKMSTTWFVWFATLFVPAALLSIPAARSEEPSTSAAAESAAAKEQAEQPGKEKRITLQVARDRAKVLHDVYATTLEVLHARYFHGDRAVVPARAMEDIFAEVQEQSQVEARWISVNMKPMSIDHEPKTAFEKKAAQEITEGRGHWEAVEEGYYRRAVAIPLTSGCVSCHGGFFKAQSKSPKFAGLVISVPIAADSQEAE